MDNYVEPDWTRLYVEFPKGHYRDYNYDHWSMVETDQPTGMMITFKEFLADRFGITSDENGVRQ